MHGIKWLKLFLIMLLSMGLLSGCNPTEKAYIDLVQEANSQKIFEDSGSIDLDLVCLPQSVFEDETSVTEDTVKKALDNHRLDFQGQVDLKHGMFQYDLTLYDKSTGEKSTSMTVICKDDMIYVRIGDLIRYLKELGNNEDKQKLDKLYGNAEYISASFDDFDSLTPLGKTGLNEGYLQSSNKQQTILRGLVDALIDQGYDQYEGNIISRNNDKYIITYRFADSIEIIKPMAIYTINNINKIGQVLYTFLNNVNEDDLGLTADMKVEGLKGIEKMIGEVEGKRDSYLAQIEDLSSYPKEEILKIVNDSELVSTIQKNNSGAYTLTSKVRVHLTLGEVSDELDFTINTQQKIKPCMAADVTVPSQGIMPLKDIESRMPVRMNLNIDDGFYSLNKGFTNDFGTFTVFSVDNEAYVPLRKVAEAMGDQVDWDEKNRLAYIEREGKQINMTGIIKDDDRMYVRSRDLESLGYVINWDEDMRMVTIEK